MNMQSLMAQAQKMQRDIQKKQEEIYNKEFSAESQAVKMTLNGKKEMLNIEIDKNIITDVDDIEALEEMIQICYKNVIEQIDKETETKLGSYAKGLNGLI